MNTRLLPLVLLVACASGSNDVLLDPGSSLASGVTITRVSIHQGPGATLSEGGVAAAPDLPIIAGRDALIRVFYEAPGRSGTAVTARLELGSGDVLEASGTLAESSTEASFGSTLNLRVPGEALTGSLDYRLAITEADGAGSADNLGALHPDEGFESHALEAEHVFRVTLVPYQYNFDGSGRLPDTSEASIAALEDRFRQLYPISDIELTVHEPVPWSGQLRGDGTGWQELAFNIFGLRSSEGAADDEYYYAMFNPADSLAQFCGAGCLLGVTLLNNDPETTGDPSLNVALGVGFADVKDDTMLHEVGHAHGRPHAPCGPGLDPNSIDAAYPHSDGSIGALAYDIVGEALVPADSADIMSYCYPQWISEHNYRALWTRMDNIRGGGAMARTAPSLTAPGELVFVEGDGKASWAASGVELPAGPARAIEVRAGFAADVEGRFYRWDHMPGGWLVLPELSADIDVLSFELDGERYLVER